MSFNFLCESDCRCDCKYVLSYSFMQSDGMCITELCEMVRYIVDMYLQSV